jgi:FkbM family methyltransferase
MPSKLKSSRTYIIRIIDNGNLVNSLPIFLRYAKYRYIVHRLLLRVKMGKKRRDEYLRNSGLSMIDFLPERPYSINGFKAIPRKGTQDFYMLYPSREEEVKPHLLMHDNETFVDVGSNVGSYSLKIAQDYKNKGVNVIAIEAHPENYKALCRNIEINGFKNVKAINKAVSDHKGIVTMYERFHIGTRVRSEFYSLCNTFLAENNIVRPDGKALQVESDTLDNILAMDKPSVMKMDIEGAEVMALNGATNTLKRLRKVVVEVHGDNFDEVKQILETHNFKLQVIRNTVLSHIIGSK